ncbi:MAG: DUF4097 family beta strand repeat protein [Acidobacteria bacterium]|nr:DUF4097 family beta strand repeat protein [Acidobacteriota bacterium]MBV9474779.1 DUF4097 family beta strand repeat protein [Acidobacteriota bacterium]
MRLVPIGALMCLVLAAPLFAEDWTDNESDCRYSAARHLTTPSSGITRIVIHADAGSLTVTGTPGAPQVVANGTACTSDEDFLPRMTLTMRKSGSELHVEASIPQKTVLFGFFQARLDFSVAVPDGVPVSIDDGSGWMKVANVGPTSIDDGSGSIEVRNVHGNLTIHDESGGIDVDSVQGAVKIEDDSGEIEVKNVAGAVEIEDDSGSITVASVDSLHIPNDDSGSITVQNVRHDVLIDSDSSGSIEVTDIGGNFTVGEKSSGGIDYERVAGRVSIPERFRR